MKPKIVETRTYPTWVACRNACSDFGTIWDCIGFDKGFAMVNRVTGSVIVLTVTL